MYAERHLKASLQSVLGTMGLEWPDKAVIESPKDVRHGDLASNIALVLAKSAKMSPKILAEQIAQKLRDPAFQSVEIAGPGFLNVTFSPKFWQDVVLRVQNAGDAFGSSTLGQGVRIQVEFVSANPTGPLHVGHGRGAAVGDSLARILRFTGFDISTEYYLNDAGRQMRLLGLSVWLRVKEQSGLPVTWPEDYYHGGYIADIAKEMLAKNPNLPSLSEEEGKETCFVYAMNRILDGIKEDLRHFRVNHEVWFSERSLVDNGEVQAAFDRLAKAGLTYEKDGALWFRTTDFGDDKDRVLRKSDGTLTYFSSDIAYHANKYQRGFDRVVDVWGADHHGYIPRMHAAVQAMGRKASDLDVVLIQLVNLLQNGEQIAMSTRAGQFETLEAVIREVGVDAARFIFLSRKSDSHLDFDLALVKQRTMENPVYYVQYAHARIRSVLRKAAENHLVLAEISPDDLSALQNPEDLALLRLIDRFEDVVTDAAKGLAPHFISYYLMELAGALHGYYAKNPVLQAGEPHLVKARLALLQAVGQTLKNGLTLLGVTAPESMFAQDKAL